ncbi:hypothetical protein SAMN04487859_14811 [Roseovarius lutimaris]|uniref:Uncharacterized protein n=1 Tax=Roseovarius lutimaris TaxID=1005928 RepID=A0A1I5H1C2_9RHOB|nr:hypothetical protein SAMN04487859_14811 [Roseovarius lutimaris]
MLKNAETPKYPCHNELTATFERARILELLCTDNAMEGFTAEWLLARTSQAGGRA